jgi:succinate dehydrogenase / fumarate reductase iron-sulfur subunit
MVQAHENADSSKGMKIYLKVWRQPNSKASGSIVDYTIDDVSPDMSFLEMLDVLNQKLIKNGQDPVSFDHDCREGICGSCSLMINGEAHGPEKRTTACQLHMRKFKDGDTIFVEPWRAKAFPVLKDLMVDRSAFDRIMAKGGYVSVNTGNPVDANSIPVAKESADLAFDAAACIGCGACVAACKNASAMLFVSAKVSHLDLLPQGKTESNGRALAMLRQMDSEGFGACSMTEACEAACPKGISIDNISHLNRVFTKASLSERPSKDSVGGDG